MHEASVYAPLSSLIAAVFSGMSETAAKAAFYMFWWAHLLILLAFLVYIPQSKHFHLLTAPLNIWFRRAEPAGRLKKLDLDNEEADNFGVAKSKILRKSRCWTFTLAWNAADARMCVLRRIRGKRCLRCI